MSTKHRLKKKEDNKTENGSSNTNKDSEGKPSNGAKNSNGAENGTSGGEDDAAKNNQKKEDNDTGVGKPKNIPRKHAQINEALVLCKNYDYSEYECLNEKGKEMMVELESLNIKDYPVAAVALCRCLLEYTLKLWLTEQGGNFNSGKYPVLL